MENAWHAPIARSSSKCR